MGKRDLEKWPQCRVGGGREPPSALVDEFDRILSDAGDERPLQTLFASHPSLLGPLTRPGGEYWCLDRPRLGAELVPDFLLGTITSVGFRWVMVELESPLERPLTRGGVPAKKLAEALKQVRDWRTWLAENIAYARTELGLKDIDGSCHAYVVIGRRGSLDPAQIKTYRALSTADTTVMTYDRLRDVIGRGLAVGASE
ncbi:Shedu anti-phage system protein SduA domain-containing protein [Povalibacter sp.]|uniref:Shedu anti-phage system protein SduA domain-containing protein n=1 Tax=Povalibacter sp. TaxID=1962978 RepID=UPI002F3F7006